MPKSYIIGMSAQEYDSYKRNYEFNARIPNRSPCQGYDYQMTKEYGTDKEKSICIGQPHKFKGVRAGNAYGKRKAMCRIPARHNYGPKY